MLDILGKIGLWESCGGSQQTTVCLLLGFAILSLLSLWATRSPLGSSHFCVCVSSTGWNENSELLDR